MTRMLCYSALTNIDVYGDEGIDLIAACAGYGLSIEEVDAATVKVIGAARSLALLVFRWGFDDVTITAVDRTPHRLEVVA